jgi:hypothetical protein
VLVYCFGWCIGFFIDVCLCLDFVVCLFGCLFLDLFKCFGCVIGIGLLCCRCFLCLVGVVLYSFVVFFREYFVVC